MSLTFFCIHNHDTPFASQCNSRVYKWAINEETEARIELKTRDLFNVRSSRDCVRIPSKLYFMERKREVAPIRFYCSPYKRENSRRRMKRVTPCLFTELPRHALSLYNVPWIIWEWYSFSGYFSAIWSVLQFPYFKTQKCVESFWKFAWNTFHREIRFHFFFQFLIISSDSRNVSTFSLKKYEIQID